MTSLIGIALYPSIAIPLPHFCVKESIQVSLVIRGRYVPLIWTANTEFAD
jgi:hypothetical protein